jgi:hypothetical protein
LLKLDDSQLYCTGTQLNYKELDLRTPMLTPSSWEEWMAGMDGFGGLILLAATLVG